MHAEEKLKQHFLKQIALTDEEFTYVYSHFKHYSFKKGQTIISAGDDVNAEYFIVSGCTKSFYVNDDLKMFILQFAMPNWWVSDYNALYYHVKATVSVDCITDTEALAITSDDREKLCKEIHQIEHFFRWRTYRGFVAAQKRLLSFMNNDAKGRYEDLMKLYPVHYAWHNIKLYQPTELIEWRLRPNI